MNIIYRIFQAPEINELCELMKQLGYKHTKESLLCNVQDLRKSSGEVFVAELDGKVVGCACAIIDVRLAAGTTGEIVSVVVEQGVRGKGIGAGLIKQCEMWLVDKVGSIHVRANMVREDASKFYGSLGYSLEKNQSVFKKNL